MPTSAELAKVSILLAVVVVGWCVLHAMRVIVKHTQKKKRRMRMSRPDIRISQLDVFELPKHISERPSAKHKKD